MWCRPTLFSLTPEFWHGGEENISARQNQKKNRKLHRFFSVVENRRVGPSPTAQRTVLYLREINDSQEAIWRKTLQVFDDSQQQHTSLSLFPEDREIPAEASNSIQVKLSEMELCRPRAFGNCWFLPGGSRDLSFQFQFSPSPPVLGRLSV